MTANAQFAGWPQIDETLDARMDRDAAEREYASLWDVNFWESAQWLRDTLWYEPFTPPEETSFIQDAENHDDRLPLNLEGGEGEVLTRISARVAPELEGNPEVLASELLDPIARKENSRRAEELFFSEEILTEQTRQIWEWSPSENMQRNQAWLDANIWEDGPLSDSFDRIKSNFILPEGVEGDNLQEIYENNPENAIIINDALSDAFLLEIQQHTLKWRINYPEIQVQELMRELSLAETTPLEKLQTFWEIHTLVNTGVAKGARLQSIAFRNRQAQAVSSAEQNQAFHATQAKTVARNHERPQQEVAEVLPQEADIVESWDIFSAWDIDVAWWSETTRETA